LCECIKIKTVNYLADNDYGARDPYNTIDQDQYNSNTNTYDPANRYPYDIGNHNAWPDPTLPDDGSHGHDTEVTGSDNNSEGDLGARNGTNVAASEEGEIGVWTLYIIVGAVAGGVLLAGLVAIAIALCCQREEESQYKSTSV